jgi:hypothetical protein
MKFLTLILAFTTFNGAFAQNNEIEGTWVLREFVQASTSGEIRPYCNQPKGIIMYGSSGIMSVAINYREPSKDVFYSGKFKNNESKVSHQILFSSSPKLIGVTQLREFNVRQNILTLSGTFNGGSVRLIWTRI